MNIIVIALIGASFLCFLGLALNFKHSNYDEDETE